VNTLRENSFKMAYAIRVGANLKIFFLAAGLGTGYLLEE
jgi:hypothetical protein